MPSGASCLSSRAHPRRVFPGDYLSRRGSFGAGRTVCTGHKVISRASRFPKFGDAELFTCDRVIFIK